LYWAKKFENKNRIDYGERKRYYSGKGKMMNQKINENSLLWNEETLWQAVQSRETGWDGRFVYAVSSTHIYCRPSCPSRRPRRELVTFFKTCAEAEAAGFRPCKRCRPNQGQLPALSEVVQQACALIDASPEKTPALNELGRQLNISPSHLHKLFKQATGLTPHQYAAGRKLDQFKNEVKQGAGLSAALYTAGYSSPSRLYEQADERLGMTPAAYRRGGGGMDIHYAIVETYLGPLMVAATGKGICSVCFGEDAASLKTTLQAEFPAARLTEDKVFLHDWLEQLLLHLDGTLPDLALPLDLQATAFQLHVWEELRKIPYGQTRSYAQVAEAIGQPTAVRAVANACAHNPAGVVTPCHRVVRSDGSPGGYRWGIKRKEALLLRERQHSLKK
jgi:AraC family transcriptional regulator, regulatory protein of adaptative response / methylated-DNA-[protein]-cysteine methyltransferase